MSDPPDPAPPTPQPRAATLDDLLALIARLRAPDGCPWDREQTLDDLRAYLLEEAHEAADAIDRHDWGSLREELGDLLFQWCFVAALAAEGSRFTAGEAIAGIHRKMVERHPHVFGDAERLEDAEAVERAWGRRKRASTAAALDGVPASLPALTASYRLGQKAAAVGFDWDGPDQVLAKVEEELGELTGALRAGGRGEIESEIGDLLQSVASLARHLGCDPERALARANLRFRERFAHVESSLGERLTDTTVPLDERRREMERLWQEAKRAERE